MLSKGRLASVRDAFLRRLNGWYSHTAGEVPIRQRIAIGLFPFLFLRAGKR
jgi:hypothetical protein